jgi:hypothetical protein
MMILALKITRFTDYVTESWVEGKQLELWNHFDNDRARTSNNVEGWHSKVNKLCQHAHPNIFATMKMLQTIQPTNEAKIIQLESGGKPRPKKIKYANVEVRLSPLKHRFNDNELPLIDYAGAASHLINLD